MSASTWRAEIRRWMAEGGSDSQITAEIGERMGEEWTPGYSAAIDQVVAAERARLTATAERRSARKPQRVRRGRGRPGWTASLYRQRRRDAEKLTPEPRTETAIAANFRGLNGAAGELGIDPDSLARLRRKFERGELPE